MLPKFLLADNHEMPDAVFVVHNEKPRFILEADIQDFMADQKVHWIDEQPADATDLLKAAADYFTVEMENIEEMFDDDDLDYEDDDEEDED